MPKRPISGIIIFLHWPKRRVQGNLVDGTMGMHRTIKRDPIMKKELILPIFDDEDVERDFWANVDLSAFFEPEDFKRVSFPNLKLTTRSNSIRDSKSDTP